MLGWLREWALWQMAGLDAVGADPELGQQLGVGGGAPLSVLQRSNRIL
jgi:hypothetical protein